MPKYYIDLNSDCEFFCASCVYFPLMISTLPRNKIQKSFKNVLLCKWKKYCQVCKWPVGFYFTLLDFAYFCNEIKKCQL